MAKITKNDKKDIKNPIAEKDFHEIFSKISERNLSITIETYRFYTNILLSIFTILVTITAYTSIITQNSISNTNIAFSNTQQFLLKNYELCLDKNITISCEIIKSVNYPTSGMNATTKQIDESTNSTGRIIMNFVINLILILVVCIILFIMFNRSINKIMKDSYEHDSIYFNRLLKKSTET